VEAKRRKLSSDQIALMRTVLTDQPGPLRATGERIARAETVSQADAEALADTLAKTMFDDGCDRDGTLNDLGLKLDDIIGVVYQAFEDFFR
jgi:hypothetical protein